MRKGTGSDGTEAEIKEQPTVEATEEVKEETVVEESAPEVETEETTEIAEEPESEEVVEEPEIKVDPTKVDSNGKTAEKKPSRPKKKMFRIIIDEQDNSDKNGDVFVTDPSDGTPFQIQRNEEVDVPEGVVNNLKECIQEKLEYDKEGNEKWRKIPRYAMRIIKELW